ncbi:hypothetical protein D9756_004632 [Leucocoprinus leucothites]|uniref:Uncharacterized protein n=1 Tax=Leucocoprinus leucothites TaxID=201217 RepID=A0A8H5LKK4_9AGAR|nr:hypothetical protein D9756_004632 [Leucoagaricus leucothites]
MAPISPSGLYMITDTSNYPVGVDQQNIDVANARHQGFFDVLPIVSLRNNKPTAWRLEEIRTGTYRLSVSTTSTPLDAMPVTVGPESEIHALLHAPVNSVSHYWVLQDLGDDWYIIKYAGDTNYVWASSVGFPNDPQQISLVPWTSSNRGNFAFRIKPFGA